MLSFVNSRASENKRSPAAAEVKHRLADGKPHTLAGTHAQSDRSIQLPARWEIFSSAHSGNVRHTLYALQPKRSLQYAAVFSTERIQLNVFVREC